MGGVFITWYFVTIFYFFTFVILWYLVTFLLGYFEFPFWSPFWQTFKIPYSWFVYVPPNSYSIWFSVSVRSFPTSNNHIYCIYFCYIWRSCHLFTFSASRTAINTSGTRPNETIRNYYPSSGLLHYIEKYFTFDISHA